MRRPELERFFDGWQVLDPTPQERSAGQRSNLVVLVEFIHRMPWIPWIYRILYIVYTALYVYLLYYTVYNIGFYCIYL